MKPPRPAVGTIDRSAAPARPLLLLACGAGLATGAAAQEPTTRELLERIEAQNRRIEALESAPTQATSGGGGAEAGYDKGYFIRSTDPNAPFELRINGRMQFRLTGFDSDTGG
jgi:hypothetical protein